jgi:hypothetical protein
MMTLHPTAHTTETSGFLPKPLLRLGKSAVPAKEKPSLTFTFTPKIQSKAALIEKTPSSLFPGISLSSFRTSDKSTVHEVDFESIVTVAATNGTKFQAHPSELSWRLVGGCKTPAVRALSRRETSHRRAGAS